MKALMIAVGYTALTPLTKGFIDLLSALLVMHIDMYGWKTHKNLSMNLYGLDTKTILDGQTEYT